MSTYEAIGGVSESLKTLLEHTIELPSALHPVPSPFPVWIGIPPKDEDLDNDPLLNLFLYRITENPGLKNQQIPGRGEPSGYGHPPLSLNLHYLITPYGRLGGNNVAGTAPDEVPAHYVLGSAMRVLHDNPVLTNGSTSGGQDVLDPVLKDEYEKVKLRLDPVSLEDVSKVWTALGRPYRLSAAYQVSVIQIESRKPRRYPQLVGKPPPAGPRVRTVAELNPLVTEVQGGRLPGPYAAIDDTLVVLGEDLAGESTRVVFGDVEGVVASARSDRLTVRVPDDVRLKPGPQSLSVLHQAELGSPPELRVSARSNSGVWMLVPHVTKVKALGGTPATPSYVQVKGTRLYDESLQCRAFIDDTLLESDAWTEKTDTEIQLPFPSSPASPGDYRIRVRVGDAEDGDAAVVTVT